MDEQQPREDCIAFDPSRFFESLYAVCRVLFSQPRYFFQQLQPSGTLKNPLIFLSICAFLSSLFIANVTAADYRIFFILLLANIISALAGSLLLHNVLVSGVFGAAVPFEATFSVIAYASITDVLSWIPVVGIIANFYGLYLIYLGFREVHRLSARRSVAGVVAAVLFIGMFRMAILVMTAQDWIQKMVQPPNQSAQNALSEPFKK